MFKLYANCVKAFLLKIVYNLPYIRSFFLTFAMLRLAWWEHHGGSIHIGRRFNALFFYLLNLANSKSQRDDSNKGVYVV